MSVTIYTGRPGEFVNPFRVDTAPRDAIRHRVWRQTVEQALQAMLARPGLTLLLGPAGTGKTLLLGELEQRLHALGRKVRLFSGAASESSGDRLGPRERFVLVDAARMNAEVLDGLPASDGLRCLLVERPDFHDYVANVPGSPVVVWLPPLTPLEARGFVAARIAQAGRSPDLLTEAALVCLVGESGGVPRAMCEFGSGALGLAAAEGAPQVEYRHVEQALEMFAATQSRRPRERSTALVAVPTQRALRAPVLPETGAIPQDPLRAARSRRRVSARTIGLSVLVVSVAAVVTVAMMSAGDMTQPKAGGLDLAAEAASAPTVTVAAAPEPQPPIMQQPVTQQPVAQQVVVPQAVVLETATPAQAAAVSVSPAPLPDPVVQPASAAPPLAVISAPRVVIIYPRRDRDAAARGRVLADRLRRAGFLAGDPIPVAHPARTAELHIFFSEDQGAAETLRTALGPSAPAADLVALPWHSSLPRPNTLELLLPANAPWDSWNRALDQAGPPPWQGSQGAAGNAIEASQPADHATITDAAGSLALAWADPVGDAGRYFVEVQALDGAAPHEVFAAYAEHGPVHVGLDPDSRHYAWRVHSVGGADGQGSGHYNSSRWYRFEAARDAVPQN